MWYNYQLSTGHQMTHILTTICHRTVECLQILFFHTLFGIILFFLKSDERQMVLFEFVVDICKQFWKGILKGIAMLFLVTFWENMKYLCPFCNIISKKNAGCYHGYTNMKYLEPFNYWVSDLWKILITYICTYMTQTVVLICKKARKGGGNIYVYCYLTSVLFQWQEKSSKTQ